MDAVESAVDGAGKPERVLTSVATVSADATGGLHLSLYMNQRDEHGFKAGVRALELLRDEIDRLLRVGPVRRPFRKHEP